MIGLPRRVVMRRRLPQEDVVSRAARSPRRRPARSPGDSASRAAHRSDVTPGAADIPPATASDQLAVNRGDLAAPEPTAPAAPHQASTATERPLRLGPPPVRLTATPSAPTPSAPSVIRATCSCDNGPATPSSASAVTTKPRPRPADNDAGVRRPVEAGCPDRQGSLLVPDDASDPRRADRILIALLTAHFSQSPAFFARQVGRKLHRADRYRSGKVAVSQGMKRRAVQMHDETG